MNPPAFAPSAQTRAEQELHQSVIRGRNSRIHVTDEAGLIAGAANDLGPIDAALQIHPRAGLPRFQIHQHQGFGGRVE